MYTMRQQGSLQDSGLRAFVETLSPDTRMVEIGCYAGESTAIFLTRVAHMTCVDPWKDYLEQNQADHPIVMTNLSEAEAAFDAVAATAPDRVRKLKMPSLDGAALIPDGSLDLVYIDGNHGYHDVLEDIAAWKSKLKPGGLLAGHDYDTFNRPGVPRAIQEALGGPDAVFEDSTWVKRVGSDVPAQGPKPPIGYRPSGDVKVLIGIPCHIRGTYQPFEQGLDELLRGRKDVRVFRAYGSVVAGARNRIVREALRQGAEYIWFLDDDQTMFVGDQSQPNRRNDLDALLARNVDAVVPLVPRSGNPFLPLLYSQIQDDGTYAAQRYLDVDDRGLIRVAAAGMGGLLIRTEVLFNMGVDGWFEFIHPSDNFDNYNEDLNFYKKLQNLNVQLWCDLDVRFGHAVTVVAYVVRQQGQWMTVLADMQPFVAFPQPSHPLGLDAMRRQNQTPALISV